MPETVTIAYLLAMVVSIVLSAYTMGFQGATLFWGKAIAPNNPILARGMQNAITPSLQNIRNLLNVLLLLVVLVGGAWLYKWYVGLGAGVVTFFGSGLLGVLLRPSYSSPFWYRRILRGLQKRQRRYSVSNDTLRRAAIEETIELLEQARRHTLSARGWLSRLATASNRPNEHADLQAWAQRVTEEFADTLSRHSEWILDAKYLPYPRKEVYMAFETRIRLFEHRAVVEADHEAVEALRQLRQLRALKLRIADFQEIDAEDEDVVVSANAGRLSEREMLLLFFKYHERGMKELGYDVTDPLEEGGERVSFAKLFARLGGSE